MGRADPGRAQCVLGNHELNVLLGAPKHGNGWFFDRDHDVHNGEFLESQAATPERRTHWLQFLERLPMALEREDLRIVHACWDGAATRALDSASTVRDPRDMYQRYKADAKQLLRDSGIDDRAALEMRDHRHSFQDPLAVMPLLPACAEEATLMQNANPLKVLTSGLEAPAETPAWAGGKWRMTNRSRWWRTYHDEPAVLIGHYWRRDASAKAEDVTGDWDYPLGDDVPTNGWGREAMCSASIMPWAGGMPSARRDALRTSNADWRRCAGRSVNWCSMTGSGSTRRHHLRKAWCGMRSLRTRSQGGSHELTEWNAVAMLDRSSWQRANAPCRCWRTPSTCSASCRT